MAQSAEFMRKIAKLKRKKFRMPNLEDICEAANVSRLTLRRDIKANKLNPKNLRSIAHYIAWRTMIIYKP